MVLWTCFSLWSIIRLYLAHRQEHRSVAVKKKRVKRVLAKLRALQKFKMLVAPESKMYGSKHDAHKTSGSHDSANSDASAADEWPNDSMTSAHSEYPEL